MKAAIYARKSKDTEQGESMDSQINRCIDVCKMREWDYEVYEDFNVSGATLERPGFTNMMNDVKEGKIKNIICYKLDRISRSVNDFSNLIEKLNQLDVGFICLKEQFDTSTPMGRAMMYITSVFAQLERETIAERVKDNMIDRFKAGKWNGGVVPFGFSIERKTYEVDGRKKNISKLIINEDEAEIIKKFYDWYLEFDGSIRNVATRANESGLRTRKGAYWLDSQTSRILRNAIYCINDSVVYDYYSSQTDVNIVNVKEEFNGTSAIMYYNRRKPHKKTTRDRKEKHWILAIGEHQGIIPGETFVKAQLKLAENKKKAPRLGRSTQSVLTGLVRCGKCDSNMIVAAANGPKDTTKPYLVYFRCSAKERKMKSLCDNKNIRADKLERLVVDAVIDLCSTNETLSEVLGNLNNKSDNKTTELTVKRNELNLKLSNIEKETNNLVDALSKNLLPANLIKDKYEELEKDKETTITELNRLDIDTATNIDEVYNLEKTKKYLEMFKKSYEDLDYDKRRELLNNIIEKITVEDHKVNITLKFLPNDSNNLSLCYHTDMGSLAKYNTITIDTLEKKLESMPENTLAERVKKQRIKNNLNIKELAKLSSVSSQSVINIEKGRTLSPSICSLSNLSKTLNVSMYYLLDADNIKENTPAQIIKKYRLLSGLTQKELAMKCNLHIAAISDYEKGRCNGTYAKQTLKTIYKAINYRT